MLKTRNRIGGLIAAVAMATTGGVLAAPAAAQAEEKPAYFAFTDYSGKEFIFKLTNDARIAEARAILNGDEQNQTHVIGRIRKVSSDYNRGWSYHLDPDTVSFFSMAIEVCDSSITYAEDHLDEAGGAFLPGLFWCPWSSKLTREVTFD
ncbi:hypothetical protein ACIA8K_16595 [Catenuloplanes sp. NPDC051500]|uniref:BP74-related protein n=1 Tax=Catenuloplanes sp. NPDC051500 TaxID=3363959 RepID=UPI0037A1343D